MSAQRLLVCWKRPKYLTEEPLLSFLSPGAEEELKAKWPGRFIGARAASRAVRADARRFYVELIARMGAVPFKGGTFRQALAAPGAASDWWFHPTAAKDCESDPAFDWIIALMTIALTAREQGSPELVLYGPPPELAAALRGLGKVAVEDAQPKSAPHVLQALASRVKLAKTMTRQKIELFSRPSFAAPRFDVALFGFWDWSVWPDGAGGLKDRYLGGLSRALAEIGLSSVYLAWLDPYWEPGKKDRVHSDFFAPLSGRDDVMLLQRYLHIKEELQAVLDFEPLFVFLKVRRLKAFRALFARDNIDYYPLFKDRLLTGFLDARLPRLKLAALACERAFADLRPRAAVSFLEHYPFARAFYEGARRAGGVFCAAVQHACYNSEKAFLFLHPELELAGQPDGCRIPQPDAVCAMGELGRSLFEQCGYPAERIKQTGSPRYEHLSVEAPLPERPKDGGKIRVLLTLSLDTGLELEMIEAACLAAGPDIELVLRDHPFSRVAEQPAFAAFKERVSLASGTLDENLVDADLVLFTYSAAAEEAFLKGRPVWQWQTLRYDASALAEIVALPRFAEVGALRDALKKFSADPARFTPSEDLRREAFEKIFAGRGDGGAASQVAARLKEALPGRRVAA